MLVFLNGQIIKEEDAKVSISDLSYQFGYGLFETIKCEQGIPLLFEAHYKRLVHSAKETGMPFPVEEAEMKEWVRDVLSANNLSNARIKIIISKRAGDKFNVSILVLPLENLPKSYTLIGCSLGRDPNSISYRHKTTSRADSYIAYKNAIEKGFNDALYLNEKNELIECTRANIFLVMEDKIITPLLTSGILSGVTRSVILDMAEKNKISVEEKNVHSLFLNKAKSVFITNAIIGIMPVSKIKLDDREYNFSTNSLVNNLIDYYNKEVKTYIHELKPLGKI